MRLNLTPLAWSGDGLLPALVLVLGGLALLAVVLLVTGRRALAREVAERRQAEEAARASEARSRALLAQSPDVFLLLDPAGIIFFDAPQQGRVLGYGPENFVGRSAFDLVHPDDQDAARTALAEVCRSGQPQSLLFRARHKDGSWRWLEGVGSNLLDDPGVRAVVINGRDITERKQAADALRQAHDELEVRVRERAAELLAANVALQAESERHQRTTETLSEERRLLRTLIDHLPDYIYVKDAATRFLLNNPAHLAVLGAAQEEVLGKTDFDFFPVELAQHYAADDVQVIQDGRPLLDREEHTIDAQGESQWVLTTKVPLRGAGGQVTGLVGMSRDITRLKQAEEKLRRAHDKLEQRVAERTAELARSNAELEQFAYVASHDLQEPLRAVAGCVAMLRERCGDQLDARAAEFMALAVDGATRMQTLINDLLEYARVGTPGRPAETADCAVVVARVLTDLQPAVRASGAHVTCEPLPTLAADPTQLTQLFQNLLANAVKFRGPHAPVIHVGAGRATGAWHFRVADNGIGIEPQYFERIFRVFQRLHPRREYPGNGIGLAICKKIVEGHGGRIWVESTPGRGSTFHFTVPDRR